VPVRALSGLVTASPLACREAAAATGIEVLSPAELANGAAVDLLAGTAPRTAGTDTRSDVASSAEPGRLAPVNPGGIGVPAE
jgi:hypothetical protein